MCPVKNKAFLDFVRFWLPVYGYAGLIFFLSAVPMPFRPPGLIFSDKLLHIIEYAILAYLLGRAAKNCAGPGLKTYFRFFAVTVSLFYGISDEFHQYFVPGRSTDVIDVLADGLGAVIGQWFIKG